MSGLPRGRLALILLALLAISAAPGALCSEPAAGAAARPNIILLVADDLGYPDYGFMGSPHVKTPHLDTLAQAGAVFDLTYGTSSICSPSLRTFLSGLHPIQWRARTLQLRTLGTTVGLYEQARLFDTLPRALGRAGYRTFSSGKINEDTPQIAGFEDGAQKAGRSASWFKNADNPGRTTLQPVFDFIDRDDERPFFLWLIPALPHTPHDPGPEHLARYAKAPISKAARLYYANISRFDDFVGRLVAHLEARGLKDTLIAFLADNGWDQRPDRERVHFVMDDDRGKMTAHELGLRTPLVLHWPEGIEPQRHREAIVSTVDLVPTLLDFGGADPLPALEGESLRDFVEGRAPWRRNAAFGALYYVRERGLEKQPSGGDLALFVRTPRWHYVWFKAWETEALYEIREDPRGEEDLARQHPAVARTLRRRILDWRKQMIASTKAMKSPTDSAQAPSAAGRD